MATVILSKVELDGQEVEFDGDYYSLLTCRYRYKLNGYATERSSTEATATNEGKEVKRRARRVGNMKVGVVGHWWGRLVSRVTCT